MNIYGSFTELIGNTPLLELKTLSSRHGAAARIAAKLESNNPTGSAKDRAALGMIRDAENRGVLKPGSTIIEPTSGNTGIGLAAVAAVLGYNAVIVMPDNMSIERQKLMTAYGAELVLSPGSEGMGGAIKMAEKLSRTIPDSFVPGQFTNPANADIHYKTTGPEIWRDTDGCVDIFISSVGSGGTITGTGQFLKSQNPAIKVIAVEPDASPVLSGGEKGAHGIQGIGAGFVPDVLDTGIYDQILRVSDADAFSAMRELAKTEGILAGISSGAAVFAALETAKLESNAGKLIVVILPDTGERYLSVF